VTRIDRHLWIRHLRAFVVILAACCLLYAVIDFADRSAAYGGRAWLVWVARLYGNRLLKVAALLAPVASLMAAGLVVSGLRRRSEWVALQAAGLSPMRVIAPLAASALTLGMITAVFDDQLAGAAALRAEHISAEHFHLWGSYAAYFEPKRWVRVGDAILHLGPPLRGGGSRDVSIFRLSPDFTLKQRIDADRMVPLGEGRFRLEQARVRRFDDLRQQLTTVASLDLELPAAEALFALAPGRPEMLSRSELDKQAEVRTLLGLPSREQRYEASARLAGAFAGWAGALVAIALALRPRRRGHINPTLVEGIAIAGALWASMAIFKSLSLAGRLSPGVSAFAPIALTAALGLWAIWNLSRQPTG